MPKAKKATKEETTDKPFAVIETGGKQYKVSVGDSIKTEKIKGDFLVGSKIVFEKVLLVDNGKDLTNVGTPYLEGAKVSAVLEEIGRLPKVTVIKFKQKSRYLKKNGHRQPFFKFKIEAIS